MHHIGRAVDALFASGALAEGAAGWRAAELWGEIVGDEIAQRTRAVRFQHGVLHVEVASSSWVQELTFLKHRIVKQLNEAVGRAAVKDIRMSLMSEAWSEPSRGSDPTHRRKQ